MMFNSQHIYSVYMFTCKVSLLLLQCSFFDYTTFKIVFRTYGNMCFILAVDDDEVIVQLTGPPIDFKIKINSADNYISNSSKSFIF